MPPAVAMTGMTGMSPGPVHSVTPGGTTGPTMAEIQTLTDVGAMTRFLHEAIAREREIDAELELLLAQRSEMEKKMFGLQRAGEVLELVRSDSDQMLASVQSTCTLAEHVSGKVRELDVAQSRVQETITRIDAIVDRTNCIDGVKSALDSEDYEAAAKYVETFLQLDKDFQGAAEDEAQAAETAVLQKQQLLLSKAKLEDLIRGKFAEAAENRDQANVERFARLFAPLGLQEEGLRSYVTYLRKVVALRARDEFEALLEAMDPTSEASANSEPDFVEVLTSLFRDVALAVENNEELLRGMQGDDAVVYAIQELQSEVEIRCPTIMKKYLEVRKLPRLAKEVQALKAGVSPAVDGPNPNPRDVEIYLEEMLMLSKRSEEYSAFMLAKLHDAEQAGAPFSPQVANLFKTGTFSRSIQDITSFYVLLEEFFMYENVRKAIRIDELVPDTLTTSMVDDVFYILQNCARRAISTGNVQPVLAALNHVNGILNNEYREALHRKLREPNLAARLFSVAGVGVAKTGTEVASALNNVDVSAEYVLKLRHDIEEHCVEVFSAPAEREKVKTCLNDLAESSNSLKQLTSLGLEELSKSITSRLRTILDSIGAISYELSEAQYAENEVNDPWVQKLLIAVESSLSWLQSLLTTNNYDSLVHLVIEFVVKRLEVIMTQKRFNQLGGLQLDRDTRALLLHFSGMTARTVRDKFARLTQTAQLLNLEKVSEILDYWGENSGPTTWRLTPAEVRRILGLRVDFKPEAIAALRL
eukprot:TRINITY_DN19407_c0_g1_i1.p1 TRINITY_DN19407_c0_g1~~TRINITY_DN19407_c0_g1_i1.p1  ORF type:complete len:758 (-),score=117.00 TRINITY_DN19407_c0_g1_i1:172-2445(-)